MPGHASLSALPAPAAAPPDAHLGAAPHSTGVPAVRDAQPEGASPALADEGTAGRPASPAAASTVEQMTHSASPIAAADSQTRPSSPRVTEVSHERVPPPAAPPGRSLTMTYSSPQAAAGAPRRRLSQWVTGEESQAGGTVTTVNITPGVNTTILQLAASQAGVPRSGRDKVTLLASLVRSPRVRWVRGSVDARDEVVALLDAAKKDASVLDGRKRSRSVDVSTP